MFETNNPLIIWTGRIAQGERTEGEEVTNGVYYYLAEVRFARLRRSDEKVQFKGWIHIIK
jgi:hypothetical protein